MNSEVGNDIMQGMWVMLRKLNLDDVRVRGDLAFFMVWRMGVKRYVEDYETK